METSEFRSASGLHMLKRMMRFAVVILAMGLATGCGVGADESYDGVTLAASSGQALEQRSDLGVPPAPTTPVVLVTPIVTQTPETTAPSSLFNAGDVALPQDPIPVRPGSPEHAAVLAPLVEAVLRQGTH